MNGDGNVYPCALKLWLAYVYETERLDDLDGGAGNSMLDQGVCFEPNWPGVSSGEHHCCDRSPTIYEEIPANGKPLKRSS